MLDGERRLRNELRNQLRTQTQSAKADIWETKERQLNGGVTNRELAMMIKTQIEERISAFRVEIEDHPVLGSLTQRGFGQSMQHQAYLVKPYSLGQLALIKEIHTKAKSGARKNAKPYKAAFEQCSIDVEDLQNRLRAMHDGLELLRQRASYCSVKNSQNWTHKMALCAIEA